VSITGISDPALAMTATLSTCNPPGVFSLAQPGNGAYLLATGTVSLSWSPAAGATSYDVYFGTGANPAFYQTTAGTSVQVNSVAGGSIYRWRVVAKNGCGQTPAPAIGLWNFAAGSSGGTTVKVYSDDFEGAFPGSSWRRTFGTTSTGWGKTGYKKNGGNSSLWCAAGGNSFQVPPSPYVPNMDAWAIYGPFSLADAIDGTIGFDVWIESEPGWDMLSLGVSVDDHTYYTFDRSGSYKSWEHIQVGFKDIPVLQALGSSTVYVAFIFTSNGSNQVEGAYVDNFEIDKVVPAASCSFTVSLTTATVPASGMSANLDVIPANGTNCNWTAISNVGWITITSGASGTGPGTVSGTIAPNTGAARTGTLTVAGQTVTINQEAAPCTYALTPPTASVPAAGGSGSVAVSAGGWCSWSATSSAGWLHVTGGASGTGAGTVSYTADPNTGSARSATITVQGQAFTLNQAAFACSYAFVPPSASVPFDGGAGSVGITTASTCTWHASTAASWIHFTGATSGTGNGTVAYTVDANSGSARSATIAIEGQTYTVNQAAFTCSYSVSPTPISVPAAGGNGSFGVTASSSCAWTAAAAGAWVHITAGASGTGNGTVTFTADANAGSLRSTTITVQGQVVTVNQPGLGCSYALAPTSLGFDSSGGNGGFAVTAGPGCPWTVATVASWVHIASAASGTGVGTILFSVDPNTGSARTASITVADQVFTVTQAGAGCSYTLSPSSASFTVDGGSGYFRVQTSPGCGWTASTTATWIQIQGGSGSGSAYVYLNVEANTGPPRSGTVSLQGQVFTVNQDGLPCHYALAPASLDAAYTGASGTVSVTAEAWCQWTAATASSWIHIAAGSASGTGNGSVGFTVDANPGDARSGTITVADRTFAVNQAEATFSVWIPAVIHKDIPSRSARWRTDVAILNRAAASAHAQLRLYSPIGLLTSNIVLATGGQQMITDIVGTLGYTDGSGAFEVRSNRNLVVTARTYNQVDPTHTYGQGYDGVGPPATLSATGSAVLPQLTQNDLYRTNIGLTNTSDAAATVQVVLHDASGTVVWGDTRLLGPGEFFQYQEPYALVGGIDQGYATVTVISGNGVVAVASVIDQQTGDPTTINMKP
jgi:hypothetical protein